MPFVTSDNRPLKIVADENMPQVKEIFSEFGEVTLCAGREMSADDLDGADILLVRSVTQVTSSLLEKSQVQFVGTATIGMDHIDRQHLANKGIAFSNAPGCNADAVVDYVISAIYLMAERHGLNPQESTFGIVGVGNVGGRLYKRLSACGFKVLLNDPPRAEQETGFVELDELIEQADFICAHTPLIKEGSHPSYHLFNAGNLPKLKEGAVLLNAGRGPVIDNPALKAVGAAREDLKFILDVWEHEPSVDPELAARCELVSPHIAGYSLDGKIRGTFMLYQAYCRLKGIEEEKQLSDFLPDADLSYLKQQDASTLSMIQQVYNPLVDDGLLRDTLSLSEAEQRFAFDQLRKQYRVRRELSSLTIEATTDQQLLSGIGFQLAEKR